MSVSPQLVPIIYAAGGTVLGAIVSIAFSKTLQTEHLGYCIATAAGMMTACSAVMFLEVCEELGFLSSLVSVSFGLLVMRILDWLCTSCFDAKRFEFSGLHGEKAVRTLILFFSLCIHSMGEGFSLGIAAASKSESSSMVYTALALHNIPEAAALSFAYSAKGVSVTNSLILTVLSTLPQALLAFPVSSLFLGYASAIHVGMGLSAGFMLYSVVSDIFPESLEALGYRAYLVAGFAAASLIVFDVYSHEEIR